MPIVNVTLENVSWQEAIHGFLRNPNAITIKTVHAGKIKDCPCENKLFFTLGENERHVSVEMVNVLRRNGNVTLMEIVFILKNVNMETVLVLVRLEGFKKKRFLWKIP